MTPEVPPAETLVACLTPAGTGAIATLALRGPRAWELVRELFQPHSASRAQLPADAEVGPVWFGHLGEEAADEVVVAVKATRPVPWVEVHCHGGREVIRLLLEAFEARGVRATSWQEFGQVTSGDPLRSAAAVALADAATVRTAGILLDQYHGAFGRAIQDVLACWDRGAHDQGTRLLQSLVRSTGVGCHLTAPWRVVVAGAPNVGKSSLINALAGYQRCVVAPTPGTTRDLVTTLIAVDGWPVELTDTAGLREAAGMLEQEGIGLARRAVRAADLCLWVLDASAAPVWPDFHIETTRLVVNKVDLEAAWDWDRAGDAVRVSAHNGSGLGDLCDALARWLVPSPPPPGAAVPFTAPLSARVEEVWRYHAAGQTQEARRVLAKLVSGEYSAL